MAVQVYLPTNTPSNSLVKFLFLHSRLTLLIIILHLLLRFSAFLSPCLPDLSRPLLSTTTLLTALSLL